MGFEDLTWLFTNDHRNRGICRLDFDEASLLYRMVQQSDGDILEIGRRHAGSTVLLAEASGGKEGYRKIISIDINPAHHPKSDQYLNDSRLSQRIELIVGNSRVPLEKPATFGMAFIDGDHSYEGVMADVRAHWNSVQCTEDTSGIVVFHDAIPNDGLKHIPGKLAHCPGVLLLCAQLIEAQAALYHEQAASMLALKKIGPMPDVLPDVSDPESVINTANRK